MQEIGDPQSELSATVNLEPANADCYVLVGRGGWCIALRARCSFLVSPLLRPAFSSFMPLTLSTSSRVAMRCDRRSDRRGRGVTLVEYFHYITVDCDKELTRHGLLNYEGFVRNVTLVFIYYIRILASLNS
jgi:hypothetical protein